MKLPFVLSFCWLATILGMDRPPTIPRTTEYETMPIPEHKHKRHSHQEITATVVGEDGKEVKLDIKQDGVLSGSTDTQDSSKSGHSTKFLALSNTVTGLITAVIGAGVTLAVRYGDCKKD